MTEHSDPNEGTARPRLWWADPVAKLLGALAAVGIPVMMAVYTNQQQQRAKLDRDAQTEQAALVQKAEAAREVSRKERELLLQTLVTRDQASATLKAQMFNSLLERYINTKDDRDRLLVIELLALNFPEDFRLRPVFEGWYRSLPNTSLQRQELRKIARRVADRQVTMICDYGGQRYSLELPIDGKPLPAEALGTSIAFKELTDAGVRVSVGDGAPFEVSFFDAPFLDQSRRGEGLVYSLLLDEVNQKTGVVKLLIVIFPARYYPGGSRLSIDQYIGRGVDVDFKPAEPKKLTQ